MVSLSEVWEKGGKGGVDLAKKVVDICANERAISMFYTMKKQA